MDKQKKRWRNRKQGEGTENKMKEQETRWRNRNKMEEQETR